LSTIPWPPKDTPERRPVFVALFGKQPSLDRPPARPSLAGPSRGRGSAAPNPRSARANSGPSLDPIPYRGQEPGPPCDARRRSGAPINEPAILGWSFAQFSDIASAVARTQQKKRNSRYHEATSHGWRVLPPGPPKVRRASQGPQGFRPEGVAARDGCESAACAGCALGRPPGGPRSAGHRAPGRRAADRRGCVGGAGGLAQARSPARAAEAARNALSLAATKQPRTQDAIGKIETWRSRCTQRSHSRGLALKTPAARSKRGGRAQARSYG